jgi:hypothetical protein
LNTELSPDESDHDFISDRGALPVFSSDCPM